MHSIKTPDSRDRGLLDHRGADGRPDARSRPEAPGKDGMEVEMTRDEWTMK